MFLGCLFHMMCGTLAFRMHLKADQFQTFESFESFASQFRGFNRTSDELSQSLWENVLVTEPNLCRYWTIILHGLYESSHTYWYGGLDPFKEFTQSWECILWLPNHTTDKLDQLMVIWLLHSTKTKKPKTTWTMPTDEIKQISSFEMCLVPMKPRLSHFHMPIFSHKLIWIWCG